MRNKKVQKQKFKEHTVNPQKNTETEESGFDQNHNQYNTQPINEESSFNRNQNINTQPTHTYPSEIQRRQSKIIPQPTETPPNYSSPSANTQQNYGSNYTSSNSGVVETYNQNAKSLSKVAIEVSETPESINQRRVGVHQAVILEKVGKNKGNYWIISESGISELVPKANFKINEYNYETVAILFNCQNYRQGYSTDFCLLEPAKVVSINQNNWQLQQKGELLF